MHKSDCGAAVCSTAMSAVLLFSCATASEPPVDTEPGEVAGSKTDVAGSGGSANGSGGQTSSGGSTATVGSGGKAATGGGPGSGGGGAGSGGASGSGGSGGTGSGGTAVAPPKAGACDALAKAGTWEQITPPEVLKYLPPQGAGSPNGQLPFGVQAIGLDPTTDGTVYLGTCQMGIWKSTDCGSTWARVNTGKNSATVDQGAQTTLVIDPINPKVIYTDSFYGQNGAFKSTDGGVNWEPFWPPADPTLAKVVAYNFVASINLDPWDHQHMLVAFHAACSAPYSAACVAETKDGGDNWRFISGDPGWVGGEGTSIYFLDNSHTFLFGSQSNGLWRSTNGGDSWQAIQGSQVSHGAGQLYRAKDGVFYLGVSDGVLRSDNGTAWSLVPNTGHGIPTMGLVGDGTNIYASVGYPWSPGSGPAAYLPYYTAPENDGLTWKPISSPKMVDGGYLAVDHSHHILYSTNLYAGFYRVVLP